MPTPKSKGTLEFCAKVVGKLGSLDEKGKKPNQRGRNSYMSVASRQSSLEIRCGKRLSLIKSLR
jgi:hypothetical protein